MKGQRSRAEWNKGGRTSWYSCHVVAMVFGNTGDDSGTGVAFTRDPNTGEKQFYGEYLRMPRARTLLLGQEHPSPYEAF